MDINDNFNGLCERDRKNLITFKRWLFPFAITFLLAVLLLGPDKAGIEQTHLWYLVLAGLPLMPGFFTVNAYLRLMKNADELIRKVHLEAAAKSFVIVIILGFIYSLATQIFGEWEDSGVVLWAIGYCSYVINVSRSWKRFNV